MTGKTILLVEDEEKLQKYNTHLLEKEGFAVETAMTLAAAWMLLALNRTSGSHHPDIIILDRGMPDGDGLDFLRELRKTGDKTPVLLLTGFGKDEEIEQGFDAGCDDYLPKPYTFGVLHKRLIRLLKNAEQVPEKITYGALTIDILSGQAFIDDDDLHLEQKEFALLLLFIQNKDRVISASFIYEKIWGQQMGSDKNAVQVTVSRLRKKLGNTGISIRAAYGKGYIFEPE